MAVDQRVRAVWRCVDLGWIIVLEPGDGFQWVLSRLDNTADWCIDRIRGEDGQELFNGVCTAHLAMPELVAVCNRAVLSFADHPSMPS